MISIRTAPTAPTANARAVSSADESNSKKSRATGTTNANAESATHVATSMAFHGRNGRACTTTIHIAVVNSAIVAAVDGSRHASCPAIDPVATHWAGVGTSNNH